MLGAAAVAVCTGRGSVETGRTVGAETGFAGADLGAAGLAVAGLAVRVGWAAAVVFAAMRAGCAVRWWVGAWAGLCAVGVLGEAEGVAEAAGPACFRTGGDA